MAASSLVNDLSCFDDDDELPAFLFRKRPVPKVMGFIETIVPQYSEIDFRSHFRLRRSDVEALIVKLPAPNVHPGRPAVTQEKKILLSLWVLATEESFRGVAVRFGLERGNSHRIFSNFCDQLTQMTAEYVRWPQGSDAATTLDKFAQLRGSGGFPAVFGCVDGTHIPIRAPAADASRYCNRKGFHSILLQVVCDSQYQFLDCFVGWPGSANDARVWNNSRLGKMLESNSDFIPVNSHLIGDCAYPLRSYLITPYCDNGHLSSKQKLYNIKLSSKRVVVEQAIGLLKNRFRRLRYLDVGTVEFAAKMTMTACILHNICTGDVDADIDLMTIDGEDEAEAPEDTGTDINYDLASCKRDAIATGL